MQKPNRHPEHPEAAEIKNICNIAPKTHLTKGVCEKVNKERRKKEK